MHTKVKLVQQSSVLDGYRRWSGLVWSGLLLLLLPSLSASSVRDALDKVELSLLA